MGLSSFWTAIKKPRVNESSNSRKHVDQVYDHHHKIAAVESAVDEVPHHLDAIYDTHHHILPTQYNGPKRHPSSPPRIHSPTMAKEHKRPGLLKSASLYIKPGQQSHPPMREDSAKRRSFWQYERKDSATAPSEPLLTQADDSKKAKRNSIWRSASQHDRLLPTNDSDATGIKAKRSSRRMSLRRTLSSQSSKRNSLRFSFLANGAGDSDVEEIPAMPAIPAHLQRQKSSDDPGRRIGMGGVQPGTAVTSDDVYSTAAKPKSRKSLNRHQSLSKLITNRKSTSDLTASDKAGDKRKRRSWFSVHGSESSAGTNIPPMPALPNAQGITVNSSEEAFLAFLQHVHNTTPKPTPATDYERSLSASRAFDAVVPTPPHLSHRNSLAEMHAPRPRPLSTANNATALPQIKPKNPRRASHCRPQRQRSDSASTSNNTSSLTTSPSLLSNEQQREWNTLRQLMDDSASASQPPSSSDRDSSEDGYDHADNDDGVLGMLRELDRDEDRERKSRARDEKRRRDRERYLGVGNQDALAALEFGARGR